MGQLIMKVAVLLGLIVGALVPLSSLLKDDVPLEGSVDIVGGDFVRPFEFPFLISLQFSSFSGYSHGCGGSIYNSKFIVDAAHCVDRADAASLRVVASEYCLPWKSGLT